MPKNRIKKRIEKNYKWAESQEPIVDGHSMADALPGSKTTTVRSQSKKSSRRMRYAFPPVQVQNHTEFERWAR